MDSWKAVVNDPAWSLRVTDTVRAMISAQTYLAEASSHIAPTNQDG